MFDLVGYMRNYLDAVSEVFSSTFPIYYRTVYLASGDIVFYA